jgi:hypothetical protein
MEKLNPVFEKNYKGYLEALTDLDLSIRCSILDISVDEDRKTAEIPFFGSIYRVSREGVVNADGKRPDYGTCIILLKYLLMCPRQIPIEDDWVSYRDFKDSGLSLDVSFSDNSRRAISKIYSGQKGALENAAAALGGTRPDFDYPYDVAAVFRVLPRVPVLLLFNDEDDEFPAKTSILFERRADQFLDMECIAMVGGYLFDKLKRTGKLIMGKNIG